MQIDTNWIDRNDSLASAMRPSAEIIALAAVFASGVATVAERSGWRHWGTGRSHVTLSHGDDILPCCLARTDGRGFTISTPEGEIEFADITSDDDGIMVDGHMFEPQISARYVSFTFADDLWTFERTDLRDQNAESQSNAEITAPMTGIVRHISVRVGDTVRKGESLVALEAMKMEHTLIAPRDGIIEEIRIDLGDTVADGSVLITLKEDN